MNSFRTAVAGILLVMTLALPAFAQRITGSVIGTVSDTKGAMVIDAKVNVADPARGFSRDTKSSGTGTFEVPDLAPGPYTVTVDAPGFAKYVARVTVRVNVATPVDAKLRVGTQETQVTVSAAMESIDTSKATVQGVITGDRIQEIPLNGRNFLQLAALEPGVQIVDGGSFDPTKNQMTGVSIGGRSGRVTRIQVDGVDITDETVGTTTMNLTNESIQEFSVSQSSLDASTDMTSSGAVNIISRSGTNTLHGAGFGFFRDARWAADQRLDKTQPTTAKPPFSRQQYGGRLGGPAIKDKLFWEAEFEKTDQASKRFTNISEFPQFSGAFGAPVNERSGGARVDWNVRNNTRAFYRFMHNDNLGTTGFGGATLAAFANSNNTNSHVAGVDITGSRLTHSVRFSYLNFNNGIIDANTFAGTPTTLAPGKQAVLIRIRNTGEGNMDIGPNLLAPQNTYQDNHQIKYDATTIVRSHGLRFGVEYNKIDEAVFASFFGLAPRIRGSYTGSGGTTYAANNFFGSGGAGNPLNFRLDQIVFGNGQGAFSERPALGFPNGGTINHRFGAYIQDSWRARPSLTISAGLRYTYNSMLYDSDLERANIIGLFDPKLLGKPHNPAANFGPQVGFAWSMTPKTVIRGGAGIFYETNIINNVLFDRPINLPPGFGNDTPVINSASPLLLDPGTGATMINFATACAGMPGSTSSNCFTKPVGSVIPLIATWQKNLQAVTAKLAANWPPPNTPPLVEQILDTEGSLVDPNVKTPYGAQFNIGVQHEIRQGLVFSADYLHNRGVHFNLVRDLNRLGAANTLDQTIATTAITNTLADFGCTTINCVIANGGTISDFANEGLCGGSALDGCAFRGVNPNFRGIGTIQNIGLSRFQALQLRLTGRVGTWGPFRDVTTNINYQLGRFESTGADQDFISTAGFNDRPTQFFGPANQDRLHQVGIAFSMGLPLHFYIATATKLASGFHTSLFLPPVTGNGQFDEIFFTDLDGDGVVEDPLTGVKPRGALGTSVSNVAELNKAIKLYNSSVAGQLTPAGKALIAAGLFTDTQLKALGAVAPVVPLAPTNQLWNDKFGNTDLRIANRIKLKERFTIEPILEIFNLFNIANYGTLSSTLTGSVGSPNGTPSSLAPPKRGISRLGSGSGSFSPGTQRAFQFAIRVDF